jgi:hypothetical protein
MQWYNILARTTWKTLFPVIPLLLCIYFFAMGTCLLAKAKYMEFCSYTALICFLHPVSSCSVYLNEQFRCCNWYIRALLSLCLLFMVWVLKYVCCFSYVECYFSVWILKKFCNFPHFFFCVCEGGKLYFLIADFWEINDLGMSVSVII